MPDEPLSPLAAAALLKPPNLIETSWDEFGDAGLFWWVNRSLHLFGWALVREVDDAGKAIRVYPARCRYRGFLEADETAGFQKLTSHLRDNVDDLVQHTKE